MKRSLQEPIDISTPSRPQQSSHLPLESSPKPSQIVSPQCIQRDPFIPIDSNPSSSTSQENLNQQQFSLMDNENPYHTPTSGHHPLAIQPEGNKYFAPPGSSIREHGLGYVAQFDDEWLLENFIPYLDEFTLLQLCSTSKAWYALIVGADVDIWKDRVIELTGGTFVFQWRWMLTWIVEYQLRHDVSSQNASIPAQYINMYSKYSTTETLATFIQQQINEYQQSPDAEQDLKRQIVPNPVDYARTYPPQLLSIFPTAASALPHLQCPGYFSDTLFQPWFTVDSFYSNKDMWVGESNIERIHVDSLTPEEFTRQYIVLGKPVVLTDGLHDWPAVRDKDWSVPSLLGPNYTKLGLCYACGVASLEMDKYLTYARRCAYEDVPLYLFDKRFGERNSYIPTTYTYPKFFQEDFFTTLRNHPRPSYRWWLIGPERSGSSFHKDPLYTFASNCLVQGCKKWILYPPHILPPGVMASHDNLQVTAPLSITEWFMLFYHETKVSPKKQLNVPDTDLEVNDENQSNQQNKIRYDPVADFPQRCNHYSQYKPVEIIQRPGDIVVIPAMWWHAVINLDFGIAVTQNQVNRGNLLSCEKFLQKIQQPSLCQDLHDSIELQYPGIHEQLTSEKEQRFLQWQQYQNAHQSQTSHGQGSTVRVSKELSAIFHHPPVQNAMTSCTENEPQAPSTEPPAATEGFSFGFDCSDDGE